jgi:uncharacterized protein
MLSATLLKPELYDDGTPPALRGGICDCGYVFFPLQHYGCERCGRSGANLRPKSLAGRGKLIASAVVHLHAGDRPAPFIVCTVALDDGPIVRTLLADTIGPLAPGTSMTSTLVAVGPGEDGVMRKDFRFSPTLQRVGQ